MTIQYDSDNICIYCTYCKMEIAVGQPYACVDGNYYHLGACLSYGIDDNLYEDIQELNFDE